MILYQKDGSARLPVKGGDEFKSNMDLPKLSTMTDMIVWARATIEIKGSGYEFVQAIHFDP